MIVQKKFTISEEKFERELFGNFDENIKLIEESLNLSNRAKVVIRKVEDEISVSKTIE